MEWISVKERLPEAYKSVLVYIRNASGEAGYDITFYCDHLYDTGNRWYLPVNITHWMPLPEPPKEDDND